MDQLNFVLKQLSLTFTVRDLMIPKEELKTATDMPTAQRRLEEYPQYDVIPIIQKDKKTQKDKITSFFKRDNEKQETIYPQHLISDATSIIDLVDLFHNDRTFYFVVVGNEIAGFLHFADLNNRLVKIPYFVLLGTVERILVKQMGDQLTEKLLEKVIEPDKFCKMQKKFSKLRQKEAEINYASLLQFSHVVDLARHLNLINIPKKRTDEMVTVRNLISHNTQPLVEEYAHIRRLSVAKQAAFEILQQPEMAS